MEIENFSAIGSIKVELNDKGLILIQGKNDDDTSQDSNGSGKSSIPDALCWCVFGETAKGQSGDKLVNRTAKKDTAVSVLVVDEDTDDVYRISRYRKHKVYKNMLRLELEQGSSWKDLTGGTDKLTQEVVNRVIGCNLEVFAAAIYAGQEAMPDLPGMTDKQLKVLVEESAGITLLQDAHEIANRHVKERKAVVQDFAGKIATKQSNVDLLNGNRLSLQGDQGRWETEQEDKIEAARVEVKTAEDAFDADLGDKITKKKAELASKAADLRSKIAGSDAERLQERVLADEVAKATAVESNAANAVDRAKYSVAAQEKTMAHACEDDRCEACGAALDPEKLSLRDSANESLLEKLKTALADAEKALAVSSQNVDTATKALYTHRDSMTDVSALTAELTSLGDSQQRLDAGLTNWNRQKAGVEASRQRLATLQGQVNPYIAQIEALDKQVDTIQAEMEDLEDKRVEAAKSLFVAEEAFRVFSPAGVRAHILDTVTPALNARTSHYLSTLTDGNIDAVWSTVSKTAKGELREKFVIDVQSRTGGETFKDLSGGEKRKVRLACAMALQDLVASRAGKPIKLFIADEIDTALDPAGLERLMAILDDKARDKGTVLVISHSDLRDFIRQAVTVTKKGGKATLESNGFL
jgi:DNA repair exonuclease SbcCD ATPase subunit